MTLRLHLPAGQHYECTGCGRCCRAAWTIAVDPTAESAVRTSRAYREKRQNGYQPLKLVEGRTATARAEDQSCIFLDSENLCELHGELGPERKPLVCQTYPFLFTETPDGIFSTLSYACPAALLGEGPPIEESRVSLEAMIRQRWDEMPQGVAVSQRVQVLKGVEISWSDYLLLETRLLEALRTDRPMASLLGAAVHLVLAEPTESEFQLPSRPLSEPYNFGGFDLQLASMVTCNLLAICEEVKEPAARAELGSLLWNGGRYRSSRFGVELPIFALREPASEPARKLLDRYIRNTIFGKRLLQDTVVSRLLALVCGLTIVLFYAEALEATETPLDALDRAFTVVESELLSHTRSFDGFFVEFEEALRNVRDGLRGS